jgi:hypothetical protein
MYKNSVVTPNTITLKIILTSVHLDAEVQKKEKLSRRKLESWDAVALQLRCAWIRTALDLCLHGLIESVVTILPMGRGGGGAVT